jgi:phosphatidylinositol glycan class N
VFTGWKINPVEFDSVFNQSSYVLQIGSPDVVRMFKGPNMESHYYPEEMEDFSMESRLLDQWVFDKFTELKSTQKLKQDGTILFLHLLGMDSVGHVFKPQSQEYLESIKFVDQGVMQVYAQMEAEFPDGKTTYVFTADHGMTNRGSHGDGDPDCTRTPLITWGSGVGHVHRDIQQSDLSPFFSSILGIPFAKNSIGVVPAEFLNCDAACVTEKVILNTKQILAQYTKKRDLKRSQSYFFRDYQVSWNTNIDLLFESMNFTQSQNECYALINDIKAGLSFYQRYDWAFLMIVIVLGYIGWIVTVFNHFTIHFGIKQAVVFLVVSIYLALETSPVQYYVYVFFPILFFGSLQWIPINFVQILTSEIVLVGYYYREAFSLYFVLKGLTNYKFLFLSIFTLLPVDYTDSRLIFLGGILLIVFIGMNEKSRSRVYILQYILCGIAMILVFVIDRAIENKQQSNFVSISWVVSIVSLIIPVFVKEIDSIILGLACPFVLLSVTYEVLFYLVLYICLIESKREDPVEYLVFFNIAFFGCGNLASMSSFQLSSVYRFVTIFSPFLMAALLIFKLMIPMVTVIIMFRSKVDFYKVFAFSDLLSINFFFLVKDVGSWLEIGNSISRYALCSAQILIQLILIQISYIYKVKDI